MCQGFLVWFVHHVTCTYRYPLLDSIAGHLSNQSANAVSNSWHMWSTTSGPAEFEFQNALRTMISVCDMTGRSRTPNRRHELQIRRSLAFALASVEAAADAAESSLPRNGSCDDGGRASNRVKARYESRKSGDAANEGGQSISSFASSGGASRRRMRASFSSSASILIRRGKAGPTENRSNSADASTAPRRGLRVQIAAVQNGTVRSWNAFAYATRL